MPKFSKRVNDFLCWRTDIPNHWRIQRRVKRLILPLLVGDIVLAVTFFPLVFLLWLNGYTRELHHGIALLICISLAILATILTRNYSVKHQTCLAMMLTKVIIRVRNRRWQRAWERYLKRHPRDICARVKYIAGLANTGECELGLSETQKLLEMHLTPRTKGIVLYNSSLFYSKRDRQDLARDALTEACSLNPNLWFASCRLTAVLLDLGETDKALEVARQIQRAGMACFEQQACVADCLFAAGCHTEALETLNQMVEEYADLPEVVLGAAQKLYNNGCYNEAAEYLAQYFLTHEAYKADALLLRGYLCLEREDYAGAEQALQELRPLSRQKADEFKSALNVVQLETEE